METLFTLFIVSREGPKKLKNYCLQGLCKWLKTNQL